MTKTAVVIDDDPAFQQLISGLLQSAGLSSRIAGTATDGFNLCQKTPPNLIVTDVGLPDEDGFSLCRRLRAEPSLAPCKILMVTGTFHRDEDRRRGMELGADAYLPKPFHVAEFLSAVKRLVGS